MPFGAIATVRIVRRPDARLKLHHTVKVFQEFDRIGTVEARWKAKTDGGDLVFKRRGT